MIRYIEPEKHHAKKSFRDEYLTLLKRFDIAYEPKDVLSSSLMNSTWPS